MQVAMFAPERIACRANRNMWMLQDAESSDLVFHKSAEADKKKKKKGQKEEEVMNR